jgi:DNA uptake protein ComE-like DNA-binding protein
MLDQELGSPVQDVETNRHIMHRSTIVNPIHPSISNGLSRRSFVAGIATTGVAMAIAPRLTFGQDASSSPVSASSDGEAAWPKFNLNTITSDQILSIPAAGEQMTHEFDEYRPWTTIGQFRAEIGKYVDDDVIAGYERYVFVPVDPTAPDADTFQQIPGLDADGAAQLADGGPYADDAAFISALGDLVSVEQAELASAFLVSAKASEATWVKYNLNTITADQVLSIPGAGDQMTREFEEYRPWTTIGQFRAEIGKYVDEDIVAGYERYVFVPIAPSEADEETFQQLPGVDADIAAALVASQPYADTDAFLSALGEQVSAEQATVVAGYLVTP